MIDDLHDSAEKAYALYDAQLTRISNAQSEVNAFDARVDAAKRDAQFAHRNLETQELKAGRLCKAAMAAVKALYYSKDTP